MVSKYVRLSILKLKRAFCLMAGLAIFPGLAAATTTINHQFSPATINQGDVVPYTITIANDSLIALTAADVTVVLPADIGIASPLVSVNGCNFSSVSSVPGSSSVVLTGGTIPAKVAGIEKKNNEKNKKKQPSNQTLKHYNTKNKKNNTIYRS